MTHLPARRFSVLLGATITALVAAACEGSVEPTPSATATPTAPLTPTMSASASATPDATEAGEETSAFDLEVGDCFNAGGDAVGTVTTVDCAQPHVYEAFAVFDHEADADTAYPGDDEMLEYADAACQSPFEDYVGIDYQSSVYWITSVTPSQETWEERDDREIVCALKLGEEGTETTGSAEGSGE